MGEQQEPEVSVDSAFVSVVMAFSSSGVWTVVLPMIPLGGMKLNSWPVSCPLSRHRSPTNGCR